MITVLNLLIKIFNFFADKQGFKNIDELIFKSFQQKYSQIITQLNKEEAKVSQNCQILNLYILYSKVLTMLSFDFKIPDILICVQSKNPHISISACETLLHSQQR